MQGLKVLDWQLRSHRQESQGGVEMSMIGSIRLKGKWRDFTADQLLLPEWGFIWHAEVDSSPFSIKGFDAWVNGSGGMDWRILKVIPFLRDSSPNTLRSAKGRMAMETIFVPDWIEKNQKQESPGRYYYEMNDERVDLRYEDGDLKEAWMTRWGNPDGQWEDCTFGALIEETEEVEGIRIPVKIRAGWHFGTPQFEQGEFFRAELTEARFW